MQPPDPPLPTFLIIGARKRRRRGFAANLGEHPDVFTAEQELSFFNHQQKVRRWGLDWYRQQFVGWAGEPVLGEATPGYMIPRHDPAATAKRIERNLPDVRLIAVLRDPIDRANSALRHHQRRKRLPQNAKLSKVCGAPGQHTPARAGRCRALRRAPPSLSAAVRYSTPGGLARRRRFQSADGLPASAVHIGAEPSFVPPALEQVVFSNQSPTDSNSGLTPEERREMWPYFRNDVKKLQKIIGRDLSMWNPDSRPYVLDGMASSATGPSGLQRPPAPTGDGPGRTQYTSAAHRGPDAFELKAPPERFGQPTTRHVGRREVDGRTPREHRLVTRVHMV